MCISVFIIHNQYLNKVARKVDKISAGTCTFVYSNAII